MDSPLLQKAFELKERGNMFFRKGDVSRAFECYDRGILKMWKQRELVHKNEDYQQLKRDLMVNVALCIMKEGDYSFALDHCNDVQKEIERFKNDPKLLYRKAECEKESGNDNGAIKSYTLLLDIFTKQKNKKNDNLILKFKRSIEFLEKNKEKRLEERRKGLARDFRDMSFGKNVSDEDLSGGESKNMENDFFQAIEELGKDFKGPKSGKGMGLLTSLLSKAQPQIHDPSKWSKEKRNEMSRRAGLVYRRLILEVKRNENWDVLCRKLLDLPKPFVEILTSKMAKRWNEKLVNMTNAIKKEPIEKRVEELVIRQTMRKDVDFENSNSLKQSRRATYPLAKEEDEKFMIETYQLISLWNLLDDFGEEYVDSDFPYLCIKRRVRHFGKIMEIKNEKLEKKNRMLYLDSQDRINGVFQRLIFLKCPTRNLEFWWDGIGGVRS